MCTNFIRAWYKYLCKCGRNSEYTVTKILPTNTDDTVTTFEIAKEGGNNGEESKEGTSEQDGTKKKKPKPGILKTAQPVPVPSEPVMGKKGKKEKPRNPNILDYPDQIIYKAVQHPDYTIDSKKKTTVQPKFPTSP